ncbi:MAG: hypothetical protein GY861_14895 [bacterium]|nr:hypothetical protein [bacterium]
MEKSLTDIAREDFNQAIKDQRLREKLERQDFNLSGLAEGSELPEQYLRVYVVRGEPFKAQKLADSGVSIDWSNEQDVVNNGYRIIANNSFHVLAKSVEFDYKNFHDNVHAMERLTNSNPPTELHEIILEKLVEIGETASTFLCYAKDIHGEITQKMADSLYTGVTESSPTRTLDNIKTIYRLSGKKAKQPILQAASKIASKTNISPAVANDFLIIDETMSFFDYENTSESELESLSEGASPRAILAAFFNAGHTPPQKTIDDTYKELLDTNASATPSLKNTLNYLKEKSLVPSEELAVDFYCKMNPWDTPKLAQYLPISQDIMDEVFIRERQDFEERSEHIKSGSSLARITDSFSDKMTHYFRSINQINDSMGLEIALPEETIENFFCEGYWKWFNSLSDFAPFSRELADNVYSRTSQEFHERLDNVRSLQSYKRKVKDYFSRIKAFDEFGLDPSPETKESMLDDFDASITSHSERKTISKTFCDQFITEASEVFRPLESYQ